MGTGDGEAVLAPQGCSGDEREMAKTVADIISKTEKPVIAEGQEPPEFWVALGGKSQYANNKRYQLPAPGAPRRPQIPWPLPSATVSPPPGCRKRTPPCPPGSSSALTKRASSWPPRS